MFTLAEYTNMQPHYSADRFDIVTDFVPGPFRIYHQQGINGIRQCVCPNSNE